MAARRVGLLEHGPCGKQTAHARGARHARHARAARRTGLQHPLSRGSQCLNRDSSASPWSTILRMASRSFCAHGRHRASSAGRPGRGAPVPSPMPLPKLTHHGLVRLELLPQGGGARVPVVPVVAPVEQLLQPVAVHPHDPQLVGQAADHLEHGLRRHADSRRCPAGGAAEGRSEGTGPKLHKTATANDGLFHPRHELHSPAASPAPRPAGHRLITIRDLG